ncbi:uncharacterized protein [Watersipora subatra]|uniref:uncharacterized protein n=1 Tax=Watersipora subatra TaxID=2589382 RepID=UPI00355AD42B
MMALLIVGVKKQQQQAVAVHATQQRPAPAAPANRNRTIPDEPPPPYQRYETREATAPSPEPPKQESGPLHIMISYQWDVQSKVLQFRERLHREGYRVWIDMEQMHKSETTYEAMAVAVRQASVVVPVLTNKYPTSENCKKEIQFAAMCHKPIVPVKMEQSFDPKDDWLIELLGNTTIHNLSDLKTYEQQFINFLGEVANSGSAALMEAGEGSEYNVFHRQTTGV